MVKRRLVRLGRRCGVPRYNLLERVPRDAVESSLVPAPDADKADLRQCTERAFFHGALVSGAAWLAMAIIWLRAAKGSNSIVQTEGRAACERR